MTKNRGINLERELAEQDGTEYTFGAISQPSIVYIPPEERDEYLPKGERQNIGEEKFDCATRWIMNKLECELNWLLRNKKFLPENEKWLRDNGYVTENGIELSDRFIAVLSNTTRQGNSLKAPLQATHQYGVIPKSRLPQAFTFDEHHDKEAITGSLLALGEQFKKRFKINYEKVFAIHFKVLLNEEMFGVAGYAWESPVKGVYPKSTQNPNHAFLLYNLPAFQAFDNYEEAPGDFTKNLAPDYNFYEYGYRVYISAQYIPSDKWWIAEILSNLWQLFFPLKEKVNEIAPLPPVLDPDLQPIIHPIEKPMNNAEKFYKVCIDALDTDPSTPDNVKDEVGCADTLSALLKKVFPDFPTLVSTKDLDQKLFMDKRFERIADPEKGCIIISPRTNTTFGHAGVFITTERIASNSSKNGLFKGNYDFNTWITEFKTKRGLRIYLYRIKL